MKNWNKLPIDVRWSVSIKTFHERLNTFLFQTAFIDNDILLLNSEISAYRYLTVYGAK